MIPKLPRTRSSGIIAALALLLGAPAALAQGQDTARARLDSITEALRSAQARLEALEQKVQDAEENGVHTRSGTRMELSGRVITQAFGNTGRVNNVDNPQFVRPDDAGAGSARGGGLAMRQTIIAFRVSSPDVSGAQFTGDLTTDFHGGQMGSSGGRTFPLIRLRTARAALRWSRSELMVGQEVPLISQVNPVSVAASGTPLFATAGNLWLWLPQVRFTAGGMQPGTGAIQLAVLAPTSGEPNTAFETDNDAAERSQRPYLQARARWRWQTDDRLGEIGCGGHVGWLAVPTGIASPERLIRSDAVACDLVAPFRSLELRAEAFRGAELRGLGGGGIGQSGISAGMPVKSVGGWAQVNFEPSPIWGFGGGCGMDNPDDATVNPAGRLRNVSCGTHFITHPSGPLLMAVEARRIVTRYAAGSFANDHISLVFGFEF